MRLTYRQARTEVVQSISRRRVSNSRIDGFLVTVRMMYNTYPKERFGNPTRVRLAHLLATSARCPCL